MTKKNESSQNIEVLIEREHYVSLVSLLVNYSFSTVGKIDNHWERILINNKKYFRHLL